MASAGAILVDTLDLLAGQVREGVSTAELDGAAERHIRARGATPTFKGYRGFPGSICASPNAMVVHGIPGPYRLKEGDVISIDVGVTLDGWVADAARTFAVGEIERAGAEPARASPSSRCTRASRNARPGPHRRCLERDPARAEGGGLAIVRSLVGHGVGRNMHEDPQVPNYGSRARDRCWRRAW